MLKSSQTHITKTPSQNRRTTKDATKNDFSNKMFTKLHCYFGHSCSFIFTSSSVKAKKNTQRAQFGSCEL
jgi:hypothetical protein